METGAEFMDPTTNSKDLYTLLAVGSSEDVLSEVLEILKLISSDFNTRPIRDVFEAVIRPLVISRSLVRWEVPLVIATSALLLLMAWDGNVGRLDGGMLFAGCVLYTTWSIRMRRYRSK